LCVLRCVAVCCGVLRCVAVCCGVLRCVVMCVALRIYLSSQIVLAQWGSNESALMVGSVVQCVAVCCGVLRCLSH